VLIVLEMEASILDPRRSVLRSIIPKQRCGCRKKAAEIGKYPGSGETDGSGAFFDKLDRLFDKPRAELLVAVNGALPSADFCGL
jgi:hypothetical protein